MKNKKRHWTEKPIISFVISLIGLGFVIYSLAYILGLTEKDSSLVKGVVGILFGFILMYPAFKKKRN